MTDHNLSPPQAPSVGAAGQLAATAAGLLNPNKTLVLLSLVLAIVAALAVVALAFDSAASLLQEARKAAAWGTVKFEAGIGEPPSQLSPVSPPVEVGHDLHSAAFANQ